MVKTKSRGIDERLNTTGVQVQDSQIRVATFLAICISGREMDPIAVFSYRRMLVGLRCGSASHRGKNDADSYGANKKKS